MDLVSKIKEQFSLEQDVIEKVVTHNYKYLNAALSEVVEVELAGFGRLYFNVNKAKRDLLKCEDNPFSHLLKQKINQYEILRNSRGLEKQPIPQGGDEGTDREDIQGQNGDLRELSKALQES